jgi:glycerate dehydrogenase
MKIIVLDGNTLNPSDLNWLGLEQLGELTVYDRTSAEEVFLRAQGAEILITNKTPISGKVMEQLPELKFISVLATGYNIVDIEAAKRLGIRVSNVPGYSTASVVQLTFAFILEFTHHVQAHSDGVHAGKWASSKDFCYWDHPLVELEGKTLGIIGFGDIGKRVADIATAFGMNIIAHSRTQTDQNHRSNFHWVGLDELFNQSDIVSLHCPLTEETKGLINGINLKKMKPTCFLVNTSRGPLVVEKDLALALNEGWIAGAGIDVLSSEPPGVDNPLLSAKNCFITPHIAWASLEARTRLMGETISNVKAYLSDTIRNSVGA